MVCGRSCRPARHGGFLKAGRRSCGGQGLLLDTCVYIDQMQNRAPALFRFQLRRAKNYKILAYAIDSPDRCSLNEM